MITPFSVAIVAVLLTMSLAIVRALAGPTLFDRVLAGNSFGTATVLFISLHGYLVGRPEFLDLALVYALMNFIGTLAVLKFMSAPDLATADSGAQADPGFDLEGP